MNTMNAKETLGFLAKYNSWRRGDETLQMPPPDEIGAAIDDAVNLLRKYDETQRLYAQMRLEIENLAYWSRSNTETRISLRDRIADALAAFPSSADTAEYIIAAREATICRLEERVERLAIALRDAISTYDPSRAETIVSAERQEAWQEALKW